MLKKLYRKLISNSNSKNKSQILSIDPKGNILCYDKKGNLRDDLNSYHLSNLEQVEIFGEVIMKDLNINIK